MAKVLVPLMSGAARNQLGRAMVFFPWKGIQAVRSYVIPANPNTAAQQQVRNWLKDAVLKWRTLGYTAVDKAAFNAWALILPKVMSGFNAFMSDVMNTRVLGKTPVYPYALATSSPATGQLKVDCKVSSDISDYICTAWIDTKERGKLISTEMIWSSTLKIYTGTKTGLVSGTKYWVYVELSKTNYAGVTGDKQQLVA